MAENGILDYQGMNQAIYRGATSNIVVDTQSMSIEIGAGNSSHTSNLHIECDHDANVASIQLNSNVVTEFPRSKKLIKYPRVAMTGASAPTGYVASASSNWPGASSDPWQAFDNIWDPDGSGTNSWESHSSSFASGTTYVGPRSSTGLNTFDSNNGEYLNIKLPEKIVLQRYEHTTRANRWWEGPYSGFLYGSNDGFTTYDKIHTFSAIDLRSEASYIHTVNATKAYNEYRFHVTQTQASVYVSICLFDLFGTPEYDPEAHGTDVTVKSYPNVPNTDWLEVYYDAKNYTSGVVQDETSNSRDATLDGVGYDSVSKSFTFDGGNDKIHMGPFSNFTPTSSYTVSLWFKVPEISSGEDILFHFGHGTGGESFGMNVDNGKLGVFIWDGTSVKTQADIFTATKWVHTTCIANSDGTVEIYFNGILVLSGDTGQALTIPTNPYLSLGIHFSGEQTSFQSGGFFKGSIANFRLFNRALTSDEIYQLYAYQKEYFGHGDLSMTLKAGRLGIGTSEPRAALDVRGDIYGGCPVYFQAELTSAFSAGLYNNSINGAVIPWNQLYENTGCYNTTTGLFTAPMTAVYKFGYSMRSANSSNPDYWTYIQKNGAAAKSANDHPGRIYSPNDYNTNFSSFIMDLRAGDTVGILLASTSTSTQISNSYGYFHGHYFGESRGQHDFWD